jgi:hypothetical protein
VSYLGQLPAPASDIVAVPVLELVLVHFHIDFHDALL